MTEPAPAPSPTTRVETIRTLVAVLVAAVLVIVGAWQQNWLIAGAGASFLGLPGLASVAEGKRK